MFLFICMRSCNRFCFESLVLGNFVSCSPNEVIYENNISCLLWEPKVKISFLRVESLLHKNDSFLCDVLNCSCLRTGPKGSSEFWIISKQHAWLKRYRNLELQKKYKETSNAWNFCQACFFRLEPKAIPKCFINST